MRGMDPEAWPAPVSAASSAPSGAPSGDQHDVGLTTFISRVLFSDARQIARPERVAQRLEEAIEVGLMLEGERLPTESQLADEVGAGISTLRQALAILRTRGLVTTRRGRGGGSFVTLPVRDGSEAELPHAPLMRGRLARFTLVELTELDAHRRAISGMSAALAAERALPVEIEALRFRLQQIESAAGTSTRRRADTQLAVETAAAAQSAVLAEREMVLRSVLGDLLWWSLGEDEFADTVATKRAVIDAVEAADGLQARSLTEELIVKDTRRLVAARIRLVEDGAT